MVKKLGKLCGGESHCPIQDYLLLDVRVIYMLFADASSSFSLDYASHQGRREAINIGGGGGGGLSSCFDQHFLGF